MRKITLNCTRLSNVLDNRISFSTGGGLSSPLLPSKSKKNFLNGFDKKGTNNKRVCH